MSHKEELIYLFAAEYALSRQTYVGAIVADEIRRNICNFSNYFLTQIVSTIAREDSGGRIDRATLEQWRYLQVACNNELNCRSKI